MVDFSKAFREGLAIAKAVEVAKKEIDEVFSDLNQALEKASMGNISIGRHRYVRKRKPSYWRSILAGNFLQPEQKEIYTLIVVSNPRFPGTKPKELAKWKQDRPGYPCRIIWENADHTCEDREALENSLAELLQDPIVGEQMNALMQLDSSPLEKDFDGQEDTGGE